MSFVRVWELQFFERKPSKTRVEGVAVKEQAKNKQERRKYE